MSNGTVSVWKLILFPSVITLGVTMLRLTGELLDWSPVFFSKAPGGRGAIVGITWLAVVFAIYFAIKLENAPDAPVRKGKAITLAVVALILAAAGAAMTAGAGEASKQAVQAAGAVVIVGAILVMRGAWPTYWKVMLAYAIAARLPVLVVTYFAIRGNWGTHYDVAPRSVSFDSWAAKYIEIGVLPQLFLWIPVTVILCGLIGIIVVVARKPRPA